MARLPQPGSDDGVWGSVLNDYLSVSHASDGTVKPSAVSSSAIQDDSITNAKLAAGSGSDGQVLTKDSGAGGGFAWTSVAGSPDATTSSKGLVQLAGDLGGTAASPTVPGLANKANSSITIGAGTGLTGGGDLTANRTLSVSYGTASGTAAQGNDSRITGAEQTANKGAANGYASLNSSTRVPTAQLGSGTADNTTYLRGDGAWAAVSSGGGVTPINGGGETYFDAGNSSTAVTLDLANGNVQKLTLTANCTITLTSPASGAMRALTLLVFQDGTGSRTITWPGTVKWGDAGAPALTTTASRMDIISLFTVDGGTNWYGALGAKGF